MRYIKYLNERSALKFLEDKTLKYTPLNEFNDPFEGNLLICGPTQEIKNLSYPLQTNIDIHNRSVLIKEYQLKEDIVNNDTSYLDDEEIFKYLCGQSGVACLCLSKSEFGIPNNMLMWAHYSRDHKGIAIAFDTNHYYFKEVDHVHYVKEKLILDYKLLLDHAESLPVNTFFPKDECWRYENEVRLSKWQSDLISIESDKDNSVTLLDNIPLDAIKEIFVGCKASPEMSKKINEFCNINSIEYIQLKKNKLYYGLSSDFSKQKIDNLSNAEIFDLYLQHQRL